MSAKQLPLFITVTGPSGTGKDAVIDGLRKLQPNIHKLVSGVTRPARPGEVDGQHYHFLTMAKFDELWDAGDIVEFNLYNGNKYGALKHDIEDKLKLGHDVIKDFDFGGVSNLKAKYPANLFSILLMPPSVERLAARLTKRNPALANEGQQRLKQLENDLPHLNDPNHVFSNPDMKGSKLTDYDAVFINDDLDVTIYAVADRIEAERKARGGK